MTSASEWLHFHQTNPPPPSTTANPPPQQVAPPEGRVSKPTRRRTRASRRTPTTLLNTDPANFRAMVQQFTGGPATSFGFDPPQMPAPWNPDAYEVQQFQNYAGGNNMVQQGAGREGEQAVFGNINVGIFPAMGISFSENRNTNNNGAPGF